MEGKREVVFFLAVPSGQQMELAEIKEIVRGDFT